MSNEGAVYTLSPLLTVRPFSVLSNQIKLHECFDSLDKTAQCVRTAYFKGLIICFN